MKLKFDIRMNVLVSVVDVRVLFTDPVEFVFPLHEYIGCPSQVHTKGTSMDDIIQLRIFLFCWFTM